MAGLIAPTLGGTVTVDWNCPETSSYLFADKSQLELALVNLILNARDAMPNGGTVQVTIDEVRNDQSEPFLRIRVSDHGQGIAPELVDRITEPFFTTKEAGKGTGLGLSMVMGFVQQSGGCFNVETGLGQGTTIELLLPSTAQPPSDIGVRSDESEFSGEGRSILLVDDDDAVRTVLGEQLRDLGMEVATATSGHEAINLLQNSDRDYDLLMTDFAMPGLNGIETIRSIRKKFPEMRAILMTGYADNESIGELDKVVVIRKPIDMGELKKSLVAA